jgi:hypothetical protein
MKSNNSENNLVATTEKRQQYVAPHLKILGSMAELTKGSPGSKVDSSPGSGPLNDPGPPKP